MSKNTPASGSPDEVPTDFSGDLPKREIAVRALMTLGRTREAAERLYDSSV